MFKDFAFKRFELREIGGVRLAVFSFFFLFFPSQTLSGRAVSRKSSFFFFLSEM